MPDLINTQSLTSIISSDVEIIDTDVNKDRGGVRVCILGVEPTG